MCGKAPTTRAPIFGLVVALGCLAMLIPSSAEKTYYPDAAVYHTVDRYNSEVLSLEKQHPSCVKLETPGKSRNGEPLYLIRMTDWTAKVAEGGAKKVVIMITFGEHAREYLPVESFFKLVRQLAFQFENGDAKAQFILQHVELLLVGLVNPDGRRHLERTKNYCWRGMANGVDVNRNFGWEYGGPGSSADPKNEEYKGTGELSEPESRTMKDIAVKNKIDAFMSMHTGVQYIFVPYSDTMSKRTQRRHPTTDKQLSLTHAMWAATGGFFTGTGIVNEMNDYTADGTMADYFAGVLNVPYALTFELYGKVGDLPNCFEQFNPDSKDLDATLTRMHPMYDAAFLHLIESKLSIPDPFKPAAVAAGSDWIFHRGLDSEGSDLYRVNLSPDVARRVSQLKEMCNLLPECAGFMTSGWLKRAIVPSDKLVPWSGAHDEGLYVKVSKTVTGIPVDANKNAASGVAGGGVVEVRATSGGAASKHPGSESVVTVQGAMQERGEADRRKGKLPADETGKEGTAVRGMNNLIKAQESILRIKSRAEALQAEISSSSALLFPLLTSGPPRVERS